MELNTNNDSASVEQAAIYLRLKQSVMERGETAYELLRQGKTEDAAAVLDECLAISDAFSQTHALFGLVQLERGDVAGADAALAEAERLDTNPAWVSLLRIRLLMQAGELEQARETLAGHVFGDQLKRERLDIFTDPAETLFTSADELDLPDFLCLGAQKSGTTWLHINLQANQAIFLPRKKESQHFSQEFYPNLALYSTNFKAGRGLVRGEISPSYAVLPDERIRFIAETMPDLKLIYVMRNPIERAFSALRMDIHIVKKYADRIVDAQAMLDILKRDKHYVDYSKYTKHIDAWEKYYDKGRFLFCFMEDIIARPDWLLEQVSTHLGVPMADDWNTETLGKKIFASKPMEMPDGVRDYLRTELADEFLRLESRFGHRVAGWL